MDKSRAQSKSADSLQLKKSLSAFHDAVSFTDHLVNKMKVDGMGKATQLCTCFCFIRRALSVDGAKNRFRATVTPCVKRMEPDDSTANKIIRCMKNNWMSTEWLAATIDARFMVREEEGNPLVDSSQARVEASQRSFDGSSMMRSGGVVELVAAMVGLLPCGKSTRESGNSPTDLSSVVTDACNFCWIQVC